jgi:hypothetical protein
MGTATPTDATATTRLALWHRILRITVVAAARLRPWAMRTPRQPTSWRVKKGNAELLTLIKEFLVQEHGDGEQPDDRSRSTSLRYDRRSR